MPDSIALINTMQIEQGKLEEFRESVKSSLTFVEATGPPAHGEVLRRAAHNSAL